jgi:Zn-dependent protease
MLSLTPARLIARLITLMIAFSVHEFFHAWTADWFGDSTPRREGRLTLNPLAHVDLLGALMLLVTGFGWARPVRVNPYSMRRDVPSAYMWVSLAGPLSNLVLAVVAAIPFRLGWVVPDFSSGRFIPSLGQLLLEFVFLNLILALFNLIPLAPLDGEKVLSYLSPAAWMPTLERIRPYGPAILLGVIFLAPYLGLNVLQWVVMRPAIMLLNLLMG